MQVGHGEIQLLLYWDVLRQRRWAVYGLTALAVAAAIGWSLLVTPLYRATATVEIQRQNPDILTFQDLSRVDYSWAAYSDFYQTQYRILASEAIAMEAADRADLLHHPDFASEDQRPGLMARLRSLIPRSAAQDEPDPLEVAALRVQGGLEIAPIRNSHLTEVSWVSHDPELAARVANAVVNAYIHYTIESKFSTNNQATEFLVEQIATLKNEIATIESRLQDYGEAKRIVSIDDSSNITLKALSDISQKRTESQALLAEKRAAFEAVRSSPPEALPEVLESALIARLKTEYAEYEAQLSEKSRTFKDDWPEIQSLRSKLEQVGKRLEQETREITERVLLASEAEYRQARDEVRELEQLLDRQETAAQRLRRDAVEYANLQSEVENKRETLSALITRQNEMALSTRLRDLDATSSNIRIVARARAPRAPFAPDVKFNLGLGLVAGLGLGLLAAFLLDYLDSSLASPKDVAAAAGVPTLAVIPRQGDDGTRTGRRDAPRLTRPVELIAHHDPRSIVAESYRDLRTSILLSGAGKPPRQIMITSSMPEEGKSATSMNFAVVLAQLGRRVLLVDADLRRPRLHKVFDVENARGLSTYLSGIEDDPGSLPLPTPVPGLDFLSSGPIPPNPSELLDSPRFAALARHATEAGYDHVVLDSPPCLSVSDPVIIAKKVDSVILVVRALKTPRQSVSHASDRLRQAGAPVAGAVLNDHPGDGRGYGKDYRYYAYGAPSEAGDDRKQGRRSRDAGAS